MKKILLGIFAAIMINQLSYASTSKQTCDRLKDDIKIMQKQLPIEIDYMTSAVGVYSIYTSNRCILNYSYVINSDIMLIDMSKKNGFSRRDNLSFLKSKDGYNYINESLTKKVKLTSEKLESLRFVQGMKVVWTYSFDDESIAPIVIIGIDNQP